MHRLAFRRYVVVGSFLRLRGSVNLLGMQLALHPHTLGRWGEWVALCAYVLQGFWPAPRGLRSHVQTDLLLQRGVLLVLVEVKTRRRHGPYPTLGQPQRQRLQCQCRALAAKFPQHTIRADLCLVMPRWPLVRIYPNALLES